MFTLEEKQTKLLCTRCKIMKNESSFSPSHRNSWSSLCADCKAQAKQSFYNRIRTGETMKHKAPRNRSLPRAPPRPEGSFHKRCPSCRTHLWVIQTDLFMPCWKCGKELKITHALRDNTCHKHGIILTEVL